MERERADKHRFSTENDRREEVNGNLSASSLRKRKKKKQQKYLDNWVNESCAYQQQHGHEHELDPNVLGYQPPPYWAPQTQVPLTGQRLMATVSDPAVCRYTTVPVGYSLEPVSLPLQLVYQPTAIPSPVWTQQRSIPPNSRGVKGRPKKPAKDYPPRVSYEQYFASGNSGGMNGEEFASLPPATQSQESETSRRRFSDPGLGPAASDDGSDSSSHSSSPELLMGLAEQVAALKESNRRLCRELQATRAELETLKQKASPWRHEYEPGVLSDLIREVRDAAKVREEALLARVVSMMRNSDSSKTLPEQLITGLSLESNGVVPGPETSKAPVQASSPRGSQRQSPSIRADKADASPAPAAVVCVDSGQSQQIFELEKEKLQLRRELQEAVDCRKECEDREKRLERLVVILRKKINAMAVDEKSGPGSLEQCPSSLETHTSESLASTASSSTHSPHVTMSGPVTDL